MVVQMKDKMVRNYSICGRNYKCLHRFCRKLTAKDATWEN